MSTLTDSLAARDHIPADRRFYPRVAPQTSIPLHFGDQIACTILNLSENGILVSGAPAPDIDSVHRVSLQLDDASSPISVFLHTVWSDHIWQKSGLQFLDLAEADRAILRAWSARQLDATSPASAPVPTARLSSGALLPTPNAESAARFATATDVSPTATAPRLPLAPASARGRWFPALERHRRVPLRYFWASFAATIFLGATWASVEGFLPDKIVRTPVARLRLPRHATESAPSPPSARPAKVAPASLAPSPSAPPAQVLRSTPAPSLPLRGAVTTPKPKTPPEPQLPAPASLPALTNPAPAKPSVSPPPVSPASPNTSAVSSAPSGPSAAAAPFSPPLNPRPVSPNPAPPTATAHTEGGFRQPVPTLQPAAPPTAPPDAPIPSRVSVPPAYSPQILQIPSANTSAYVQLPGERVVRSPYLTMHIQRSVWVKASHWFWHGRKRVDLGELTWRVDPQMPRFSPGYGKPEYGSVTVLATIAKNGQVSSIRPLYGSAQLLPSVSTALHNWRYEPTYVDHQPVETLARIEVDFHRPDR